MYLSLNKYIAQKDYLYYRKVRCKIFKMQYETFKGLKLVMVKMQIVAISPLMIYKQVSA